MLFSHLNLCLAFLLEMIASKLHQFGAGLSADVDTMMLYLPQSTNLFEKEIGKKF